MDDVRFLENKFSMEIKEHINNAIPNLINTFCQYKAATDFEDVNLCFDLIFNMNFTISIRIRKHKYIPYNDLTIRSKTKNGFKTEIDKIKEGLAQIYFYAYMNENENKLVKIRIANVEAIRKLTSSKIYEHKKNNDGTEFFTYKFADIKKHNGNIYQYDYI